MTARELTDAIFCMAERDGGLLKDRLEELLEKELERLVELRLSERLEVETEAQPPIWSFDDVNIDTDVWYEDGNLVLPTALDRPPPRFMGSPSYDQAPSEPETEALTDLFAKAMTIVIQERKATTSYVQRKLSIGYNRAADLIDRMEAEGVIGPADRDGRREILVDALSV